MRSSSSIRVLLLAALVGGGTFAVAQGGAGSKGDADSVVNVNNDSQRPNESQLAADQSAVNARAGMQPGDSHVRIVRLSDVRGTVKMDRTTGQGMEPAIQNMPIVEKAKLETAITGLAQVEFEDQSTLGLAPDTLIEFPQLVRHETGGTTSSIKLLRGTLYVNLEGTKGNEFSVHVGDDAISVAPGTRLRLEIGGPNGKSATTKLAVFSGSAQVQGEAGETTVGKKETLTLGETVVAKNVEKEPFDSWNKDQEQYQQRYAKGNSLLGSQGYGVSDLNYYGNFINMPGCGMMWQPYFVDAAWNPYASGLWALYPGAGYSWVSPYPWGWLPYHSGEWAMCGGAGWGWRPGGAFYGLRNVAYSGGGAPLNPTRLNGTAVHSPLLPKPPVAGAGSLVIATHGPVVSSRMENDGFVFQKNSAGLGVPRGQLGNLNKISTDVVHHGAMTMPVDVRSMSHAGPGEAHGPVSLRPAGQPEVHGANNMGGGQGGNRGNEAGNRGSGNSGGGNSGGAPQHSAPSGGGGNFGGGGGHGGGGAPPSSPPSSGGGGAAPSGGSHK